MMNSGVEDALERRRIQNRIAQRRFRRKQNLQKAVDWDEAQEDACGSMYLDIQTMELSPGGSCSSTGLFSNSSVNCAQGFGGLGSSYGDSFLLDNISFLEHSSTASVQDYDPTFSTLQTSPTSSPAIEKMDISLPSSLPNNIPTSFSSNQRRARSGSINSIVQGSYDLDSSPLGDSSFSPSGENVCGWLSPLHIAAQKGHDRIVRILLRHNIDCNEKDSDGLTPIIHAVIGGHEDVVRSLLSHGVRIGSVDGQQRPSALHWAVLHRRGTLLRVLLNHCLEEKALIDCYDDTGRTPLHLAIDTDFEDGVVILLQFGADPQYKARKA